MTTALDFATFYSEQKWDIFPVKSHDKTPLVKWADEATHDIFQIAEWWSKYPDANIGLATGRRSGVFALDVDAGHGGIETLKAHTDKNGQLPKTPTSNTGGGGNHYLFQWDEKYNVRNSAGKLGAGLDTRGDGGYIVVPQSVHPNGNRYMWQIENAPSKTPIAKAPEWLLKMLFTEQVQPLQTQSDGAYTSGGRNNALTQLAGAMRRKNMSEDEIFIALNAVNLNRCVPPLPEHEVALISKSVSRYAAQDAPQYQNRDRATAEWGFCKTIYECPDYVVVHHNVSPEMFSDKKLAEFWTDVVGGMGVGQAAANAEILTDIEKYQDWALPRLEDYANAIKHYSRMERYSQLGYRIQKAAEDGSYEKIDRAVNDLNTIPPTTGHIIESISEVADDVEHDIIQRSKDPREVWGIHYAWDRISKYTGGKHAGTLNLLAGEPKIGKSYWKLQDILNTSVKHEVPAWYWCGEMRKKQLMRRFYALLGVNPQHMNTGNMTEKDWDLLKDAKALILNSPLYIDDTPLSLYEIRPILTRLKDQFGIQEFVIDYASKVIAPGKDEIEQSNNISRELKEICNSLNLVGTMIASVNKQGMDGRDTAKKSNVRGSGQQIHDADNIFQITSFPEKYGMEYGIAPLDYPRCIALNISAGRELTSDIEGGFIPYMRELNSPKFRELEKKA